VRQVLFWYCASALVGRNGLGAAAETADEVEEEVEVEVEVEEEEE
jgi:hypothetical protein